MTDSLYPGTGGLAIRENFAWNLGGKLAFAISRALIMVVIAKLGSAEMVGQYAIAFAITTPIFVLADLDLRSVLSTDTKNALRFDQYFSLRFFTTFLAMAMVGVAAVLQTGAHTGWVVLLVGAAKGFETLSDILYGLMQKNERLDKPGISLILRSFLSLLVISLVLWLRQSLIEGVAALAAAWLAVLVMYDIPAGRAFARIRINFDFARILGLARTSFPLGVVLLFASLGKNLPNYFLQSYWGTDSLGYFTGIVYIMATGGIVVSSLGQSANARLARLYKAGDIRGFVKIMMTMSALAASVGGLLLLLAVFFGRDLLTILYSPEYAAYAGVFTLLMCAAVFSNLCEVTLFALTATRNFKVQPYIHGSALAAGLVLCRLWIPTHGLAGAAWSILATSCLQLGGNLVVLGWMFRGKQAGNSPEKTGSSGAGPSD